MHYVLELSNIPPIFGSLSNETDTIAMAWLEGIKFSKQAVNLVVNIENSPEYFSDYFEVINAPIVSKNFIECLENSSVSNFEYYPVKIDHDGKNVSNFFALNIIGRIKGLDIGKSKLVFDDDDLDDDDDPEDFIARIKKLHLKESAVKDHKLFRLDEYQEIIIVSQEVAESLKNVTGIKLSKANGWSDSHRF